MMCEKYLDVIDDLIEGELSGQTAERVNLHIFACPECAFRYEILKQEKSMYARYLFDVEPPDDLPVKFRTKMKSEANNTSRIARIVTGVFGWKTDITEFLRLHPASAVVVLLVVFGTGFGLLKFMPDELIQTEKEHVVEIESGGVQFPTTAQGEIDKDTTTNLPAKAESGDYISFPKSIKKPDENRFSYAKGDARANVKSIAIKPSKIEKQKNSAAEKENLTAIAQPISEEQIRRLELRNLEKETAAQIEKIELLLRSFRNARIAEGGEVFDVSYEKQQAKKLLEKNFQLRRIAENYETLYTEEILSQVEPYLLDISHLEINPSTAKVLDIKERVKNQNIIARLQVYY
jgi:hypothetical protein